MNKWMSQFLKDEKSIVASQVEPKVRVLTASPSLNWALGGGFYRGYTTALYGHEASGKSLISMMGAAALHQSDPDCIVTLISTEMRDIQPERLRTLGGDPERLLIRKVNTLHDVFDWIASTDSEFKNSDGSKGGPGLAYMLGLGAPVHGLIIDSIKGIQGPKEQATESSEQHFMGDISFFLNPALRRILPVIREHNLMTIFVQQVTMNMDANEAKYVKWKVPGGQALKHFCEHMAMVERVKGKEASLFSEEMAGIRDLPVQEGHTIRVKIEKANLDSPFREAEFRIHYKKGVVDTGLEIAKLASGLGVLSHPVNDKGQEIKAQWVFDNKKWIGFDKAVSEIETDPDLQRRMMSKVWEIAP